MDHSTKLMEIRLHVKQWLVCGWLLSTAWGVLGLHAEGKDPSDQWVSAYAWMRTGDQLAEANQWPLALGSYMETSRLLEALVEAHPDFEPEMVSYRREALSAVIQEAEAKLTSDEHEVMMKYLDFIESLEQGEAERYKREWEASANTLRMAKSLLDEIVEIKPDEFQKAVAPQYERLESSLSWVESQAQYKAMSLAASRFSVGSPGLGTTEFITAADMPVRGGSLEPSLLFPYSKEVASHAVVDNEKPNVESNDTRKKPVPEKIEGTSVIRFRMNHRTSTPSEPVAQIPKVPTN